MLTRCYTLSLIIALLSISFNQIQVLSFSIPSFQRPHDFLPSGFSTLSNTIDDIVLPRQKHLVNDPLCGSSGDHNEGVDNNMSPMKLHTENYEGRNTTVSVEEKKMSPLQILEKDVNFFLNNLTIGEDDTIYPSIFGTSNLSMTRVWDLPLWRLSTSRKRYFRYIGNIHKSRLLKRIIPALSFFTAWSILYVSLVTNKIKAISAHYVPLTSLSLVSSFIAFLITLRSNQSLGRLAEARQLWGRLFIVTRDTAQLLVVYVYPKDQKLGLQCARHLLTFPWLLKDRLRNTNCADKIINTMFLSKASDKQQQDLAYITSQRKKPAACILRIRQLVADLASRNVLPYAPHQQIETNLNEMNYILGMCERLKGSPIPPLYTSHASRLLVFYLFFLPMALHGSLMKRNVTVLVTSAVSYAMLGLDEISHVLEQPFGLMPLQEISRNIMLDVADAFICQPPSFVEKPELMKEEHFTYPYNQTERPPPSYWP